MQINDQQFYFDFNASAPISQRVIDFLQQGNFNFANPSSIHRPGQLAKKAIRESKEFLLGAFHLTSAFEVVFHSGATEGLNLFLSGSGLYYAYNKSLRATFLFSETDHSAVLSQIPFLERLGHRVLKFPVNKNGELILDWFKEFKTERVRVGDESPVIINYLYVNNETGVTWSLDDALKLKELLAATIHVDAVQSVGKIAGWDHLMLELDAYTFSGHKFGALKGVGMSFFKRSYPFSSLIQGGGQQGGIRSGTENVLGIQSLKIALSEVKEKFSSEEASKAQNYLEQNLLALLGENGGIAGVKAKLRAYPIISLYHSNFSAQTLVMSFDQANLAVGSGSACSSGVLRSSPTYLAMGLTTVADKAIRLSFSPFLTLREAQIFYPKIEAVLKKFL